MVARKPKHPKVSKEWHDLLRLMPGYDPFETAEPGDWFDPEIAQLYLDFFQHPTDGCLRHVEGIKAGELFILEPWEQCFIANLFGWQRLNERGAPVRRYTEALLYIARKNGKTPLAAAISLAVFLLERERGKQLYCAAAEREQAGLVFRHAKGMVSHEPLLSSRVQVYGGRAVGGAKAMVLNDDPASALKVLSADSETKHGFTPSFVCVDEVHAHPNRDLVDTLKTAMGSANRLQPLTLYLTTADYDHPSICNELHDYACKVRDGVLANARFLPVIYEVPLEDDWTDEKVWIKANPNLGVSVSLDFLRAECQRAQEVPTLENTFRRLHLNQRTTTDVVWMKMPRWDECSGPVDLAKLKGRECYGGLDLSSEEDTSSFVLYFPNKNGPAEVLPFFWIPSENAHERERRHRVPYLTWQRQGLITLTPGDIINHNQIQADIVELGKLYNIKDIGVDRWNAAQIIVGLGDAGFTMAPFGQGFTSMTSPTKDLYRLVLLNDIAHGGNPILRWMVSNTMVDMNPAGDIKPTKIKGHKKIDGIVALIMAIGRAMQAPELRPPTFTIIR